MLQYWMIVERLENWQADHATNFQMFGLSSRYRRLASKLKPGDLVFAYVSRVSAFADVRVVREQGSSLILTRTIYDAPFDYRIETEPHIVLDPKYWLPLRDVLDKLELTRGRKLWQQWFRTSLRQLSKADGKLLLAALKAKPPSQRSRSPKVS